MQTCNQLFAILNKGILAQIYFLSLVNQRTLIPFLGHPREIQDSAFLLLSYQTLPLQKKVIFASLSKSPCG